MVSDFHSRWPTHRGEWARRYFGTRLRKRGLRLSERRGSGSRLRLAEQREVLITFGESRCRSLKGRYCWFSRAGGYSEQPARGAGCTVCRVVRMMCARARGLDMRPRVGPELPLHQWRERQEQLGRHEQTNQRPRDHRWKNAGGPIACHGCGSLVAFVQQGESPFRSVRFRVGEHFRINTHEEGLSVDTTFRHPRFGSPILVGGWHLASA